MNIAALTARADSLCRDIYASLPFEVRLADLFTKLALDSVETLGRALGAEFLLRGVKDMPDPGPTWNPQARNPALTLPHTYMKEFASGAYGMLIKKFHDPSVADEAVQRFLLKLTTTHVIKPVPRRSAESFVRDGLIKAALDVVRHRRRVEEPEVPLDEPRGDGRTLAELLDDPRALRDMQRELSPRIWRLWMAYLAKHVHVDIPRYIAFSMQGFTDAEIIGSPARGQPGMLPHYKPPPSGPNSYLKSFVYEIPRASRAFFGELGEELPVA
jgi:hypothetical protein